MVWVELHENEASRATEHNIMASFRDNLVSDSSFLKEDDIPGSSWKRSESVEELQVKVLLYVSWRFVQRIVHKSTTL